MENQMTFDCAVGLGWWIKSFWLFFTFNSGYCVTVVFIYLFFIVVEWQNEQSWEFMIKCDVIAVC